MKVSVTLKWEDVGLGIFPKEYKQQVRTLCDRADKNAGGYITLTAELPKKHGTDEQNRTLHALVGEYWRSGCSSDASFDDIKTRIKLESAGALYYIYLTDKQHVTPTLEDIPKGARYVEIPKSWIDFTREERTLAIELLINEMIESGVNTKKFDEIMGGIEK